MTKDIFFALLTVRLLKLQFVADMQWNDKIITFRPPMGSNKNGSIYITNYDDHIQINCYKISKSCYTKEITKETIEMLLNYDVMIESIIADIKLKLKLTIDIKK